MAIRFIYLILVGSMISSCSHGVGTFVQAVDEDAWTQRVEFDYVNVDTLSLRSIDIFFRCNTSFKDTIIPLRITYALPDARIYTEEFKAMVTVPEERSRIATVISVPYRSHACFGVMGHYIIDIEPLDSVSGLEAVGMKIYGE